MYKPIKYILLLLLPFFVFSCNMGSKENRGRQSSAAVTGKPVAVNSKAVDKNLLYGSWIDNGEAKLNFTLNSDGTAKSDNMETLLYKNWKLNGNKITFTIESVGNHSSSIDEETYSIVSLDKDKMVLKGDAGTIYNYTRKKE